MAKNKKTQKPKTKNDPPVEPEAPEEEIEEDEGEELTPELDRKMDCIGLPEIAHKHVMAGCKYCGVDGEGVHILHNVEGYHRVASDGQQLDLLGDGLPDDYLASLKK